MPRSNPAGGLSKAADELFTRYFTVKLESGQFYGPSNFHRGYWDGLESLLLTFRRCCGRHG